MSELFVPYSGERSSRSWPVRLRFGLTWGQVLLLPLVLGAGLALLLATIQVARINTLGLLLVVTLVGLWRCRATAIRLADTKLSVLGTFWLIKVGLTLFLLYAGWMPQLDPADSSTWGYDPQRYYQYAYDLVEDNWNPAQSTNYQGIVFYYGVIFYLLGHNAVIPALINNFVTLIGTLFLIRVCYDLKWQRAQHDWTLAYLLLVPEVVWFDVMTSRETLSAVLVLCSTLSFGRYLVGHVRVSLSRTVLLGGTCLAALLAVRTSMAIPVVVSVVMMALFLKSSQRSGLMARLLFGAVAVGLLALGPLVAQMTGGYHIDYLSITQRILSFEGNVAARMEWSENSIGLLLAPSGLLEAILFVLPRTVLYLVAPLPDISISIKDLLDGSWLAWQRLCTIPTSLLMIGALPYALAGFSQALKQRKHRPAPMVLHISFWITLLGISGGNIIIQERYRIMMMPLMFACAWLGYTSCSSRQVSRFAYPWFGLLAVGAMFYLAYKTL